MDAREMKAYDELLQTYRTKEPTQELVDKLERASRDLNAHGLVHRANDFKLAQRSVRERLEARC